MNDTLKGLEDKARGKAQEVEGDVEQKAGEGMKGGLTKLKGKASEIAGDFHLNAHKENNDDSK